MQKERASALLVRGDSRHMESCESQSVELVVTSPPYWNIKDYGEAGQIGHGQSLHEYLRDLGRVWEECFRVLRDGGRLCVNIGDQFARASVYGRYRVIPLHAEIVCQCAAAGFDYLGSIIWRKKTTMNTTGGAVVMGSYPYPPNGIVEIDFEYILLFRKPGASRKVPKALKEGSAMSRDEWKSWFAGHWDVGGAKKKGHEAPFPEEIPWRLIRMFSFPGDTVLDPFLGTGTTAVAAVRLGRNAVGYEINRAFVEIARASLSGIAGTDCVVRETATGTASSAAPSTGPREPDSWRPSIPDLLPTPGQASTPRQPELATVFEVGPDCTLLLDTGIRVQFLDLRITDAAAALRYLKDRVLKKKVFLREETPAGDCLVRARVILKNRISINAQLVKAGMAEVHTDLGR
jgi:DNA modification methylase